MQIFFSHLFWNLGEGERTLNWSWNYSLKTGRITTKIRSFHGHGFQCSVRDHWGAGAPEGLTVLFPQLPEGGESGCQWDRGSLKEEGVCRPEALSGILIGVNLVIIFYHHQLRAEGRYLSLWALGAYVSFFPSLPPRGPGPCFKSLDLSSHRGRKSQHASYICL